MFWLLGIVLLKTSQTSEHWLRCQRKKENGTKVPLWDPMDLHVNCHVAPERFLDVPQLFPASWSFPLSRLFASGGQSIGVSASISVLAMNIQD